MNSFTKGTDSGTRAIYVVIGSGLCNRIRPALSSLFMGHKLGLPVYFRWREHEGCLCTFDQLFEPTLNWVDMTRYPLMLEDCLRYNRWKMRDRLLPLVNSGESIHLAGNDYFWAFHKLYGREANVWIARHIDRYFIPIAPIRAAIEAFAATGGWGRAIGVHARRGDFLTRGLRASTCDDLFREIDRRMQPGRWIFLATDDGTSGSDSEVIRRFQERYPGRLRFQRKQKADRSELGVQEALADLWLLRKCGAIIGSRISTFSSTAAIGKTDFALL